MKDLRPLSIGLLLLALLLLAGCDQLSLEKSISMEEVYPAANECDVTVYYTVPYPPAGKVYVLWLVNPGLNEAVDVGQVPGGFNQTARAKVNFDATGAVVSIEDTPTPARMSSTWALKVGTVVKGTPTAIPVIGLTPVPSAAPAATPNAATTPNAGSTPNAATPSAQTPAATP
jgi:hypothetical protein